MLFQRLYNWIKYKTLPPSMLFKNRLFVERDARHHKIFNNFGLIFRNSKWSNYETYNIKLSFRTSFYRFISLFVFVFIGLPLIFNFNKYYIYFWLFSTISFMFWSLIDAWNYLSIFLTWAVVVFNASFVHLLYYHFFFNIFDVKKHPILAPTPPFFHYNKIITRCGVNRAAPSSQDYNWVLYSWLLNDVKKINTRNFDKIFANPLASPLWQSNCDLIHKLFKVVYCCNLFNRSNSTFSINHNLKILKKPFNPFLQFWINNWYDLVSYRSLKSSTRFGHLSSSKFLFLNARSEWNPFVFHKELHNYNHLLNFKSGLFFLKNANLGHLHHYMINLPELLNLNSNLQNNQNSAKWDRWAYRYSILHRKSLKNSHKLTMVKKLTNSGFFTNSLFVKNMWASEHFSKLENFKNFFSSLNIFYVDSSIYFFDLYPYGYFTWSSSTTRPDLRNLAHYENSLFWYLKRYYTLNNLSFNNIKSSYGRSFLTLFKNDPATSLRNSPLFAFLLYNGTRTFDPNVSPYNFKIVKNIPKFGTLHHPAVPPFTQFYLKDLFIETGERDLLLLDNLEKLLWMGQALTFSNKLFFFVNDPVLTRTKCVTFAKTKIVNNFKNDKRSFFLFFDLSDYDDKFISDLLFFFFLNNL